MTLAANTAQGEGAEAAGAADDDSGKVNTAMGFGIGGLVLGAAGVGLAAQPAARLRTDVAVEAAGSVWQRRRPADISPIRVRGRGRA